MSQLYLETILAKSAKRLERLHPTVKKKAEELIHLSFASGVAVIVTQGFRTFDEQAALYEQGRAKPGPIVTNAKAGQSYHNYGLAIDFALLLPDGRTVSWDMLRDDDQDGLKDWLEVVAIGKTLGFAWGGDWSGKFRDYPHFEMTFGLSISALLSGKRPAEPEEDFDMSIEDANQVIEVLKTTWAIAAAAGSDELKQKANQAANACRRASGQPEE